MISTDYIIVKIPPSHIFLGLKGHDNKVGEHLSALTSNMPCLQEVFISFFLEAGGERSRRMGKTHTVHSKRPISSSSPHALLTPGWWAEEGLQCGKSPAQL